MIIKAISAGKEISVVVAFVLFTVGLCFAYFSTRQSGDDAAQALNSLLAETFPANEPGAAVLIMRGDSVIFDHGYGLSRLPLHGADSAGRVDLWQPDSMHLSADNRIDGNTFFNIASCSKQFTAVAVLQLADRKLLDINLPVVTYMPELTAPVWQKITIAHLLSHSSGIPDNRGYLSRQQRIDGDEQLALEYLYSLDTLRFEPGTAYEYMNPTYVLLSRIVERVSGADFFEYVRENIFSKAAMDATCYFDRTRQYAIPDMAHGYEYGDMSATSEEHSSDRREEQKQWYEYDFGEETFFATRPDGGIYSSTHELARWERALRHSLAGEGKGKDLIRGKTLSDAMSPHIKVTDSPWSDYQNRPDTYYGYGWFVEPQKGVIYHTGDNGGFKAYIGRYPRLDMTVIILSNRADWDRYQLKTQIEKLLPSL